MKGSVDYHKRVDFRALDVFVDAVSSATKDELRQAVKTASEQSKNPASYALNRPIWKRLATLLRAELKGYAKNPSRRKKVTRKKRVTRKKNPEIEIRELILWAENTEALSNQFTSIMTNLERKAKKGIYDPVLAAKLWKYWIDEAVKSYNKEILGGAYSLRQNVFTVQDRKDAAIEVERQWRDDVFYDIKKNPARRKTKKKTARRKSLHGANAFDGKGAHVVFLYNEKRISYVGRLKDGKFYLATKKADAYEMPFSKAEKIAQNIRKPKWAKSVGVHKAKLPMSFARGIQKITWGK